MRPHFFLSALCFLLPLSTFASVDPTLLALVPQGMSLITGLDADRARSSSFGQYMLNRVRNGDSHLEQFVNETGFDPRRDLQSFVFAGSGGKGQGRFAILARGIFDEGRMEAAAKAHGATVETYKGTDLFVGQKANAPATGFAFLDSTTAVLADTATLKQVLDERDSAPAGGESALAASAKKANDANDAWYVSSLPGSALAAKLRQQTGETAAQGSGGLRGVVESSGGIRFGDVVQFSFDALTRSAEDATSLEDLLRFLASAAQMQRDNDPRAAILASGLDSMSLDANGPSVHAGVSFPEAKLEQLMDSLPGAGAKASGAKATARLGRESRP